MPRKSYKNKGKLFELLRTAFTISFFHKPTMENGDDHYYFILNDSVQLKVRLHEDDTYVIDGVQPLTIVNLDNLFEELLEVITAQEDLSILIDISGDTSAIRAKCVNFGVPAVDNEEYSGLPENLYNRLKTYYKNDPSKYGLWILSLENRGESDDEWDESVHDEEEHGYEDSLAGETLMEAITESKENTIISGIQDIYDDWKFTRKDLKQPVNFAKGFTADHYYEIDSGSYGFFTCQLWIEITGRGGVVAWIRLPMIKNHEHFNFIQLMNIEIVFKNAFYSVNYVQIASPEIEQACRSMGYEKFNFIPLDDSIYKPRLLTYGSYGNPL